MASFKNLQKKKKERKSGLQWIISREFMGVSIEQVNFDLCGVTPIHDMHRILSKSEGLQRCLEMHDLSL